MHAKALVPPAHGSLISHLGGFWNLGYLCKGVSQQKVDSQAL